MRRRRPVLAVGEAPGAEAGGEVRLGEERVGARGRVRVAEEGGDGVAEGDERGKAPPLEEEQQGGGGGGEGDEVQRQDGDEERGVEVDGAGLVGGRRRLREAVGDGGAVDEDLRGGGGGGWVGEGGGVEAAAEGGDEGVGRGRVVVVEDEEDVLVVAVEDGAEDVDAGRGGEIGERVLAAGEALEVEESIARQVGVVVLGRVAELRAGEEGGLDNDEVVVEAGLADEDYGIISAQRLSKVIITRGRGFKRRIRTLFGWPQLRPGEGGPTQPSLSRCV